jgi:hypothetical protein
VTFYHCFAFPKGEISERHVDTIEKVWLQCILGKWELELVATEMGVPRALQSSRKQDFAYPGRSILSIAPTYQTHGLCEEVFNAY